MRMKLEVVRALLSLASAFVAKILTRGHKADLSLTFRITHRFQKKSLLFSKVFKMDFDDDEAPPQLVDVAIVKGGNLEEPKPVKVPITIVTGKF